MTTVTVSSQIAAPVDRVFDIFTDLDRLTERVSGIKQIEVLTAGPFNLHTRWRETRHALGRDHSEDLVVTAFDRGRGFTVSADDHGAHLDTVFTFEPADAGTRVTIQFYFDTRTFPARLMAPLGWAMSGRIREAIAHDLSDVQRIAEAGG